MFFVLVILPINEKQQSDFGEESGFKKISSCIFPVLHIFLNACHCKLFHVCHIRDRATVYLCDLVYNFLRIVDSVMSIVPAETFRQEPRNSGCLINCI